MSILRSRHERVTHTRAKPPCPQGAFGSGTEFVAELGIAAEVVVIRLKEDLRVGQAAVGIDGIVEDAVLAMLVDLEGLTVDREGDDVGVDQFGIDLEQFPGRGV
jgi:hypothetical protein